MFLVSFDLVSLFCDGSKSTFKIKDDHFHFNSIVTIDLSICNVAKSIIN